MNVVATTSFNKDVEKIKDAELAKKVSKVIQEMIDATSIRDIQNVKKLAGAQNAYRIKIGEYRLGFYLISGSIKLTIFAGRKDIYKYFP